ncbi:MAG TPA: CorA family divalent cation transporter [Rhodoblastus sp.]|nr:CorA family divalent cation transporter [Rhodoblastus sp.]
MTEDRLRAALQCGVPGCNWILRFDASGHAEAGSAADLDRIENPKEGFVWVHLDSIDRRALDVLRRITFLTPEAREVLSGDPNHPFVEFADRIVFGALVDHRHTMEGPTLDTDYLRFVCGPAFVVTGRKVPLCSVDGARHALADGAKAATPIALFEMIVTHLCKCSGSLLRNVAETLDKIEDIVVIEGRGRGQRAALGRARRSAVRLARQVNGLQSTLQWLDEAAAGHSAVSEVAASLGQRADALARDAANLQDRARMLQDEINAILATETNDRLYTLTVITAIILPATLVTGYFGMNTKALPLAENEHGTLYATLICVAASFGALYILRRMGLAGPEDETPEKPAKPPLKKRE